MTLPAKPPFAAPCNGCGYCCRAQPCSIAVRLLGATTGPCPALEEADGRTYCGLVRDPARHLFNGEIAGAAAHVGQIQTTIAAMLGLGMGCDAADLGIPSATTTGG